VRHAQFDEYMHQVRVGLQAVFVVGCGCKCGCGCGCRCVCGLGVGERGERCGCVDLWICGCGCACGCMGVAMVVGVHIIYNPTTNTEQSMFQTSYL